MFKIESYVTPILLSYVDKYVRDFKPADAQVSLWGGGVTLHNLVIKADVLQKEVALPFTLVSGRIHELLIQVPWTKIMSEPIVVTINTIECILSLNPPPDDNPQQETQSPRTQVVEAPPGYMQALVRRIVSNIAVRVHSLIVKYVHDDVVLSLNVKHLAIDSVGTNWEPAFADIDQTQPAIRRLIRLDDLTLCLDKSDSDGKIRFFHEPLLYRCQLELRVLTRLISANTRRARSLSVQLISSRLAWGVNNEQLVLLLRLLRERTPVEVKSAPQSVAKQSSVQMISTNVSSSNSAEPARTESWSEWAWSWLPTWMDNEGVEETPALATPIPIGFTAHFNEISLVFKIMELDSSNRRRARGIMELTATDAVIKSSLCIPTLLRLKFGTRFLTLKAHGKCVCGLLDAGSVDQPTVYLKRIMSENEQSWSWVQEDLIEQVVEVAVAVDEEFQGPADFNEAPGKPKIDINRQESQGEEEMNEFWKKMSPVIYFEYNHDRAPPDVLINPYDNPPKDFEYSDWIEECTQKVIVRPISIDISTSLLHRLEVLKNTLKEVPIIEEPDIPMRTLTVEECDALSENLPQRRTNIEINGLRLRIVPSDHTSERNTKSPLVLEIRLPSATVLITSPLYPYRVCSAACQMLEDAGGLWQGARLHVSANIDSLQAGICSPDEDNSKVCARASIHCVTHSLMCSTFFKRPESVLLGYTLAIQEANICGSAARLQAVCHVISTLMKEKLALPLLRTTLVKDAISDEEAVAIDMTFEELSMRGYITKNINTHFVTLNSAKATAFHSPEDGELKQAWLFCAPEVPTTTSYLRLMVQWCKVPTPSTLEFINLAVEPTAFSMDPLLVAWLGYQPKLKPSSDSISQLSTIKSSSSQYLLRRRTTPPSSSGRGGSRSGSGTELIHIRPRSVESSSERSEKKEPKLVDKANQVTESWWMGDNLLKLHERLNRLLLTAVVGLVQVYVSPTTVSAVDCVTVRDAMERHATIANRIFVLNLGRLSMHSNSQMKHLWQEVRQDRPTYEKHDSTASIDSFPWKTRLADVSCYTLEVRSGTERSGRDKSVAGLKSQLKASRVVFPRTVLDMVTTSITLSVVTKSLEIKTFKKPETKAKQTEHKEEERTKYFTGGIDFKPSSLKEFIRGPIRRKKESPESEKPETAPEPTKILTTIKTGPVVSLGVYLHADTPPIKIVLDPDQVQAVAAAIHCFSHILTLLRRPPVTQNLSSVYSSHKSLGRLGSELDARKSISEETISENRSEQLISIFEAKSAIETDAKLKTFFWFQWVVSHATLVIVSPQVKIAFDVDDVINTVDLQNHYNQLKVKVASASIKHYKRTSSDEWSPGALGGRILEIREPIDAKEENHFLAITVTQASISNLPLSWKELYSKLLEQNAGVDSMWEVYATMAPLEVVLQPSIVELVMTWLNELRPQTFCSLSTEEIGPSQWQWPFLYVVAGGLRLLLTKDEDKGELDDTLMLVIGKVTVSPHPENPICRQSVNVNVESTWTSPSPVLEGQQYEVLINNLAIRSAQFSQLVNQEETESEILKGTGGENPALKWSQPVISPVITPILHSVDVACILAPAIYSGGALASGPAMELNLLSDCSIEMAVERLQLIESLAFNLLHAYECRPDSSLFLDEDTTCPYTTFVENQDLLTESSPINSDTVFQEEPVKSNLEINRSFVIDSGVETVTSQSTYKSRRNSAPFKKSVSINMAVDYTAKASDYLEVFITMGVIDFSLYVGDDNSPEVKLLKPPPSQGVFKMSTEPRVKVIIDECKKNKDDGKDSMSASRSLTETVRNVDIGKTKLEELHTLPLARKTEGNVPLLHATFHQPNLYYWKRKKQKTLQVSLFNAWVGFGAGLEEGCWNAPLLSTSRGCPDPVTDILPALATLKFDTSIGYKSLSGASGQGTVQLDIERPVIFDVCTDRLERFKGIMALVKKNISQPDVPEIEAIEAKADPPAPILYRIKHYMVTKQIESITIQTGQIGVRGSQGAAGWEAWHTQVAAGSRPDRLNCRALVTALSLSAGPATDRRHVILQPTMIGGVIDATWEAWRRAEGASTRESTVRVGLDIDHFILDLRPTDLETVIKMQEIIKRALNLENNVTSSPNGNTSNEEMSTTQQCDNVSNKSFLSKQINSTDNIDPTHNYYKDDLRSGAFKLISGDQLPMAYQVTLYGSSVSWRYPHPRAITRLIAYPIPELDEEVECALELYCPMLTRWEPHTYFKLPVSEPLEMQLNLIPHDAIYALMWRVRVRAEAEEQESQSFEFDSRKFMPRLDPLSTDPTTSNEFYKSTSTVTAEQLSGVLRVDSYFAPRLMPRARFALRTAVMEINVYNSLPTLSDHCRNKSLLGGYYVSPNLVRNHRVLTLRIRNSAAHCVIATSTRLLVDTHLSSDIIDTATGRMEQLVEEFRVQSTLSPFPAPRVRMRAADVRVALHVARVCTLRSLADDWVDAYKGSVNKVHSSCTLEEKDTKAALSGRVSLWIHNKCASALRIGQDGTDELIHFNAGASVAYRWRCPTSPKKLRFAFASPSTDWHWSMGIPFSEGKHRVRLEEEQVESNTGAMFLHIRVQNSGSRSDMYLSGKLLLANMLRHNLLYKVRARTSQTWQNINSGELQAESIGLSVICNSDCEAVLKVKFASDETGWSGDIPLKECPKENVPWLVKVPTEGTSYTSVWCRVVRASADNSIIATMWPLYVLRSHLPLDADVLISTETGSQASQVTVSETIVQSASGRGALTHLVAPGTTAARHSLTFQYRNVDCPVTRDAVPLHYGVTDTSVFEKPPSISNSDDIMNILEQWLKESSQEAPSSWPYSLVTNHWPNNWKPALLQPRCDVSIHYRPIRAGGGCSLELQLCPVVLIANASPVTLTLRGHDAAPLCKLDSGVAISPPSAVLQKPFFISVEVGRETFVSSELRVCEREPGRYENPPPGHMALDRPTNFAIQCNQKVALLTIYYEIKQDINILGITSTYVLINRLPTEILVSAVAVPNEIDKNTVLQPKTFTTIKPTKEGSLDGKPLCHFFMSSRWRGGDVEELLAFLCLALSSSTQPATVPVPVRLGTPPVRRAIALLNDEGCSVPIVVTQVRHEGRWLITVAPDPCPQFVVHNLTKTTLAVAQPTITETTVATVQVEQECPGIKWWCLVKTNGVTHYSTPAHNARYPPPAQPTRPPLPFLTVGHRTDESVYEWCQPIAVADGEQLLQMSGGGTIKVRVRTHPHSTLIELLDVDQHDISASDIRRRLFSAFSTNQSLEKRNADAEGSAITSKVELRLLSSPLQLPSKENSKISPLMLDKTSSQNQPCTSQEVDRASEVLQPLMIDSDSSLLKLSHMVRADIAEAFRKEEMSAATLFRKDSTEYSETCFLEALSQKDWPEGNEMWPERERVRCVIDSIAITLGASTDVLPLVAAHLQRVGVLLLVDSRKIRTTVSIADVQVDNAQYATEQYDFAVVATTRANQTGDRWPPLWGMFNEILSIRPNEARLLVRTCHDRWTAAGNNYQELTEVEMRLGPLGLYIEDAYVGAAVDLFHLAIPPTTQTSDNMAITEINNLEKPLRLRKLHIHPLDLTLTLHTAVRMYIALDESPLRLSAFQLQDVMTSTERLTHALTVHYLSAAILGAGWVVGGLELLGAPGALAARVGNAGGGVRGVASAAAGALLRSLSSAAGSLARNLDLLAGDDDHARRAAAARRRPPPSLMAGLVAGITNFAINILGAVGGLAHHPLVGVAVGESESGAAALRRGIVGAITKPLSATADLVAYAGHGLLTQTGWDPVPQPIANRKASISQGALSGWRRDCVRWGFLLSEMHALAGFSVTLDHVSLQLLVAHKFLVFVEPETERIVEMIDLKFCTLGPYQAHTIELFVTQKPISKASEPRADEDNEYQINAAAMARVARYTGAAGAEGAGGAGYSGGGGGSGGAHPRPGPRARHRARPPRRSHCGHTL